MYCENNLKESVQHVMHTCSEHNRLQKLYKIDRSAISSCSTVKMTKPLRRFCILTCVKTFFNYLE